MDKGYTFAQALNSEDENGVVYNEIIVPCQNELMDKIEQSISSQSYNEKDILGAASSSKIKMIKQLDNTSKIKMNIGNNDKYFLFDTGASITMVDEPFSKKMILNGLFNEENLEGIMICQLADNSLIEIPVFLIDNLKIGSFTLNNVLVGTGENFILGHSVLNKFREWNIEGSSNSLILYK